MEKNPLKKIYQILVRTARVCGISDTTCSITTHSDVVKIYLVCSNLGRCGQGEGSSLSPQVLDGSYNFLSGGAGCQHLSPLPHHQPHLYSRQAMPRGSVCSYPIQPPCFGWQLYLRCGWPQSAPPQLSHMVGPHQEWPDEKTRGCHPKHQYSYAGVLPKEKGRPQG